MITTALLVSVSVSPSLGLWSEQQQLAVTRSPLQEELHLGTLPGLLRP